jgi:tight adherence protein B
MVWIPLLVFVLVLAAVAGGYFLYAKGTAEKDEIRKRLSLLELRSLETSDIPEVLRSELLSDVPALNKLLASFAPAVRLDRHLRQAAIDMKVGTFVLVTLVLFVSGIAAGSLLRWPLVTQLAAAAALSLIPHTAVNVKKRIRLKNFTKHFPDALEMFARSLRAGHSFTGAIQLVAQEMPDPIGPEFQKVFDEQNLGLPLRHALVGMADRINSLDVKFFVTAVLVQRETGGNLAEIIDKISQVVRDRFRVQGQLKIFTAQARMTGIILALLPAGVAFAISILNPEYLKPLWLDRSGRFLVAAAVVLQVTGWLVIRKIIRIKI